MTYDPQKHYWLVRSRTVPEKYFSSERGIFVTERDSLLKRFMADRGGPSVIASEQELFDVLRTQAPDQAWPLAPLPEYLAEKRWRVETGGITVNAMPISTTRSSQALITGAYNLVQLDPAKIIDWKTQTGFVPLDATAIAAIALAVGNHVQACFALEAKLLADIDAGTITTKSEIDAAAWPAIIEAVT